MSVRVTNKYVQPFSSGLNRLLANSVGDYGPTLAISHFLPVYIPSLHNSDFGGGFTDLFSSGYDVAVSGVPGEPVWLPKDVKYEYTAQPFSSVTEIPKVAEVPTTIQTTSTDPAMFWENVVVSGSSKYTLSEIAGGVEGINGWMYDTNPSYYSFDTKLTRANLFPIKDYEAPLNSDNTVLGRYVVGFKDIIAKIGETTSEQKNNILRSRFTFNAVILYAFKVESSKSSDSGEIVYTFADEAYPVAIAGIEGVPMSINFDKLMRDGSEFDTVWNIELDFIPFDVSNPNIANVTHRIVSEYSYWSKSQSDMLHTNNRVHVGLTVEPYDNADNTSETSAWLHISNKIIDPEFTNEKIDRKHIRLDASSTFSTIEHIDLGSDRGVIDIQSYKIDEYSSGAYTNLDSRSSLLQAFGGSAYGNNDVAVGVGVKHYKTENVISIGSDISVSGSVGIKNAFVLGTSEVTDGVASEQNSNVISVGDGYTTKGSNSLKLGNVTDSSDVEDEKNTVVVGNENTYVKLYNSEIVGDVNEVGVATNCKVVGSNNKLLGTQEGVSVVGTFVNLVDGSVYSNIDGSNVTAIGKIEFSTVVSSDVTIGRTNRSNVIVVDGGYNRANTSFVSLYSGNFDGVVRSLAIGENSYTEGIFQSLVTIDNTKTMTIVSSLVAGSVNVKNVTRSAVIGDKLVASGDFDTSLVVTGVYSSWFTQLPKLKNVNLVGTDIYQASSVSSDIQYANSVIVGKGIHLRSNDDYSGTVSVVDNSVIVGTNIHLHDPRGLYVGFNIYSYGRNGFAIGSDIGIHVTADSAFGNIGVIGSDVRFGRPAGENDDILREMGLSTSTVVIGDKIRHSSSNPYYRVVKPVDTNHVYVSIPSVIVGNNAYGLNSFGLASMDNNMIRVGKFVQQYKFDADSDIYDGMVEWKCPFGSGFAGLTNATEIRVSLPTIPQRVVFGGSVGASGNVSLMGGDRSNNFRDLLFVDEYGYVRQKNIYVETNEIVDIATTVKMLTTEYRNVTVSKQDYDNAVHVLNYIVSYLSTQTNAIDQTLPNHAHQNIINKYQTYNGIVNIQLRKYISFLFQNFYHRYTDNFVGIGSMHAYYRHNQTYYDSVFTIVDVKPVAGDLGKLNERILAIHYYLEKSYTVLPDGTHIHAPCPLLPL